MKKVTTTSIKSRITKNNEKFDSYINLCVKYYHPKKWELMKFLIIHQINLLF